MREMLICIEEEFIQPSTLTENIRCLPRSEVIDIATIAVYNVTGIGRKLLSKSSKEEGTRQHDNVIARNYFTAILRKHLNMQYAQIGKIIGGRDHSTVLSNMRNFENWVKTNDDFRRTYQKVENEFEALINIHLKNKQHERLQAAFGG